MYELRERVITPDDERIFALTEMLRRGYRIDMVSKITGIDIFFLEKFRWLVDEEQKLKQSSIDNMNKAWLYKLKRRGFSDKAIADMLRVTPEEIYRFHTITQHMKNMMRLKFQIERKLQF